MLVLSRHRDESIVVNDNVLIQVIDIRGDRVRLGIEAPLEMSINRKEVWDAIQREKQQHQLQESERTLKSQQIVQVFDLVDRIEDIALL